MARKQPRFRCHKCKKNLGSAAISYGHFQKHPSHRNAKQKKDYAANLALREKHKREGVLPTVRRTTRISATRRTGKFCTNCGERRMPSHNYCGGCGDKV
jgi:hypothetical protein